MPTGFVVGSSAFDAFLAAADGDVRTLLRELEQGIRGAPEVAREIAKLLDGAAMPRSIEEPLRAELGRLGVPRVSVRSSATCEDGTGSA